MHGNLLSDYLDLLALVARHELACAELRAFIADLRAGVPRLWSRTPVETDADGPAPPRGRSAPP